MGIIGRIMGDLKRITGKLYAVNLSIKEYSMHNKYLLIMGGIRVLACTCNACSKMHALHGIDIILKHSHAHNYGLTEW